MTRAVTALSGFWAEFFFETLSTWKVVILPYDDVVKNLLEFPKLTFRATLTETIPCTVTRKVNVWEKAWYTSTPKVFECAWVCVYVCARACRKRQTPYMHIAPCLTLLSLSSQSVFSLCLFPSLLALIPPVCRSVCLSIYLSVCLPACLPACLSVYL